MAEVEFDGLNDPVNFDDITTKCDADNKKIIPPKNGNGTKNVPLARRGSIAKGMTKFYANIGAMVYMACPECGIVRE